MNSVVLIPLGILREGAYKNIAKLKKLKNLSQKSHKIKIQFFSQI